MPAKSQRRWLIVPAVVIAAVISTVVAAGHGSDPTPARVGLPVLAQPQPTPSRVAPDVHWDSSLGVRLPVSQRNGPRLLKAGRASGFTRTQAGAALAAANLVPRTSPNVGPAIFGVTLSEQVRGPNRMAMARLVAAEYELQRQRSGVPEGSRLPGADAELLGYAGAGVGADGTHATVQLALTSPDLRATDRLLVVFVSLQWADGDWQLIAPPQGDWGNVSNIETTPPSALRTFGEGV